VTSRNFRSDPAFGDAAFAAVIPFPKFKVAVATRDGRVSGLRYLPPGAATRAPQDALAERAARQLERYRDDPDTVFDLPLAIEGTPLQRAVWQAMRAIPRGRTRTYGELAAELGAEARAVGQACGDNRLPIVIPCHRVVAADGIGGFGHSSGGYLIEAKRWLLRHEAPSHEFALRP
jgi:methylated-DNA-[protein]-cysteine S-methyltransferase